VIVVHTVDKVGAEYFMRMQGLPDAEVALLRPEDRSYSPWEAQWVAIRRQRSRGPLKLVLTAYGEVFTQCLRTYQSVLLYARRGGSESIDDLPSWDELADRVRIRREADREEVDRGLTDVWKQGRQGW
jgi:hypothetical protein